MRPSSAFVITAVCSLAACEKQVEEVAPPVGWYSVSEGEEAWAGACYFPPEYADMSEVERRMARQEALEAMLQQWRGQREDNIAFDEAVVADVEIALLGRPEHIEEVSAKNAAFCKSVMASGASTAEWGAWLGGLTAKLTAGECNNPLVNTYVQYLDIGREWQENIRMCKGNRALIQATVNDKYRIQEGGDWINADGDLAQPATDPAMPCNFEGCYKGQLIGRFITDEGVESVFPIGVEKFYEAPEHGTFSFMINDDTWYDNEWRKDGSVVDHTAVTIGPAD